jgi:6-phosphogluconolactonase
MSAPAVEILADPAALADRVAEWLLAAALAAKERFAVSLSGGSTPRLLYERLAAPPIRDRFPWPIVHWYWGDERFVPPDDPASNYRMVREAMLSHAPVPLANIHPVPTVGMIPDAAARAYERELTRFYGAGTLGPARPLFDVMLLGLGPDGHTASLFPGTDALVERERWVVAVLGAKAEPRITLTYPAVESSRRVAFLVAGAEKRDILRRLRAGAADLPASRLKPVGSLTIFADAAAAGGSLP